MSAPRMLHTFSCSGIGSDGYARAGFDVTCVDIDHRALKHNPHPSIHADALEILRDKAFLDTFDVVHASPPCQLYSATRRLAEAQGKGKGRAVDLLGPTLELLRDWGGPWTMENVERSPLKHEGNVARICGSSFGLVVQRHRLFGFSEHFDASQITTPCDHSTFPVDPDSGKPRPWGVYYAKGDRIPSGGRTVDTLEQGLEAMGVDRRVPWKYLCESVPPVYTEHVGQHVRRALSL